MQNYYIRIEDMPSLISHQLSIIKYVVLKKIIFYFLCFDRLIWTWTRTSLDSDLSWTRQRWTWLQPYYMNILICIQLREYTDLYSTTWIYWSVYTRLTQHTPNARSCRCNQLYLDYNSRPSKLVCVLVWLASFIQPRDVVCSYSCFEPRFSLYSHTMRNMCSSETQNT